MKKLIKYLFPTCLLSLFSLHALAVDYTTTDFVVDGSTAILSVLFGTVSESFASSLSGGGMGGMFAVYNIYISIVGVVIVFYITIVGLANSAQYGTPMGQKWSAMFMPLKTTLGAGLLFINEYGYNLAQVLVMWFILTGVNIANKVYNVVAGGGNFDPVSILDAAPTPGGGSSGSSGTGGSGGGSVTPTPPPRPSLPAINSFLTPAKNFALCVGLSNAISSTGDSYPPTGAALRDTSIQCSPSDGNCDQFVPVDSRVRTLCGTLDNYTGQRNTTVFQGIIEGMIATSETALINANGDLNQIDDEVLGNQIAQQLVTGYDALQANDTATGGGSLGGTSTGVSGKPFDGGSGGSSGTGGQVQITDIGWLGAGMSYYNTLQGAAGGLLDNYKPPLSLTGGGGFASTSIGANVSSGASGAISGGSVTSSGGVTTGDITSRTNSINNQIAGALGGPGGGVAGGGGECLSSANFDPEIGDLGAISFLTLGLAKLLVVVVENMLNTDELFGFGSDINMTSSDSIKGAIRNEPLQKVAKQGSKMLRTVETVIGIVFLVLVITGIVAIPLGFMFVTYSSGIGLAIPIMIGVLFALLAFFMTFYPPGIIFNVYVPVIPLFTWLFGIFGYFMICVEAMAAGPLIAIALLNPGQDEVLGKAEQGLTLILNLMLRPALMIVGLAASIIFVRISLLLFSVGMNAVYCNDVIPLNSVGAAIGLMWMYAMLIPYMVTQGFKMINGVPDKVMIYMGGGAGQTVGEPTEMLQAGRQGAEEGGKKFGEISKGVPAGLQTGVATGKAIGPKGKPLFGKGAKMGKPD